MSAERPASRDQRPDTSAERRLTRADAIIALLLILTMLVAAYFRFVGQNWDEYTHLHPDERFLTQVVSSLGSTDLAGYFDTGASPLNPNNQGFGFYVYGTLPLYTVRLAGQLTAALTGDYAYMGYGGIHLVGRTVSAVADLMTILVVFFVGRRLYSKWVGLLASMLYAGAVLPIQLSHFFTTDAFTVLPVTLAMWFAVRAMDEDHWYDYVLFGLSFGAALASRVNVLPLGGVLALAVLIRVLPAFDLGISSRERWALIGRGAAMLALGAFVAFLVFRVAQPYAFSGPSIFGVMPNQSWLGQMAEVSAQVSGQRDMPPNHQWASRTPYIFPLRNIIQWGMGLPLGIAGWLGWLWAGWRVIRGGRDWTRPLLPAAWILIYFGWQGRQWVMSMRYYVILYPFLCLFAAWALVGLLRKARRVATGPFRRLATASAAALLVLVLAFTYLYAYGFTGIYRRTLTRVAATRWFMDNIPGDIAFYVEGDDGQRSLVNLPVANRSWSTEGDKALDSDVELINSASWFYDSEPRSIGFTAPISGEVASIVIPHLGDPQRDLGAETFRVAIAAGASGAEVLAEGAVTGDYGASASPLGDSAEIPLESQVYLEEGQTYYVIAQAVAGAPITTAGVIIADEGPWDDPVPTSVDGKDGFGMGYYQSVRLYLSYEDAERKRDVMLWVLDHADYLTISSNRFYDSLSRIPVRWPMSIRYYQALFSGELGYSLVASFYSFPSIGPVELNDRWAEEAFHVYDHPAVMVFRRGPGYDPQKARDILYSIDLDAVAAQGRPRADRASQSPTGLELPDELWDRQVQGGTWSELYDADGPLSRSELLAVVAWWLLILILGWLAFPILFAALPGLPDKGYPLAKVLALLLISWLPWVLTSAGIRLWNQAGIGLAVVALAALSLATLLYRRRAIFAYVRRCWARMLLTELITLGLFVFWLLVRAGNPDLWHQSFGGEKPMDFAYFNAVLRSTVFPPVDPWFAGGYMNYYYFGYVIVGAPVRLLRVAPALAYNIIVPMLYALTGIGAFSLAFNLVAGLRERAPRDGVNRWVNRHASPWLGGVAAMALAVVLGNLDTIRVFVGGLAKTGGWTPARAQFLPPLSAVLDGLSDVLGGGGLMVSPHRWYWAPTRVLETYQGNAINEFPYFTYLYADLHAHMIAMPVTLLAITWMLGEIQAADQKRGRPLALLSLFIGALTIGVLDPTNHWDWITYTLAGVAALTFAAYLGFWHRTGRAPFGLATKERVAALVLGVALGAVTMGVVATNSLTLWILFALGGLAVLSFTSFLRLHPPAKDLLLRWVLRVLAFLGLILCVALPFNQWFGTTYSSVQFYQSGETTPLWAYLDMHGIFLFSVGGLLAWETVVWLQRTRVAALRGTLRWLVAFAAALLIAFVVVMFLAFIGLPTERTDPATGAQMRQAYRPLLVAVPLVLWAALLFFRPGQGREKRFVMAAIVLALAITIGVEFVVLVGDIGRQNTIFKFYIQVWLLFSVAGGAALAWLFRAIERWWAAPRVIWTVSLAVLVLLGALYPITATRGKLIDRMTPEAPNTLDGMAYMQYTVHGENGVYFSLEEDYEAIRWLQGNVEGTPVILEAQLPEYHWGARISIYTGMPTVLGWNWHQRQQRTTVPQQLIWDRAADVSMMYDTAEIGQGWDLLSRYAVSYIIVGALERATYNPGGLAKFVQMVQAGMLEQVYEKGETVIYRVVR